MPYSNPLGRGGRQNLVTVGYGNFVSGILVTYSNPLGRGGRQSWVTLGYGNFVSGILVTYSNPLGEGGGRHYSNPFLRGGVWTIWVIRPGSVQKIQRGQVLISQPRVIRSG